MGFSETAPPPRPPLKHLKTPSTFGGVMKMLSGKKFPQNVRALRMVVEELLRHVIPMAENFSSLMSELENRYYFKRI